MKNILKYLGALLVGAILVFCSCKRELITDYDLPYGKVNLALQFSTSSGGGQAVKTKTLGVPVPGEGDENELNTAQTWLLIVDKADETGLLKQAPTRATSIEDGKIYATVDEEVTDSYIHVLANVPPTIGDYLTSLTAGVTMAQIMPNVILLSPTSSVGLIAPLPMHGVSGVVATISKSQDILPAVELTRAVARIDVSIQNSTVPISTFRLSGVRLATGARKGYLFGKSSIDAQRNENVVTYPTAHNVEITADGDQVIQRQIYCYENNGMNPDDTKNPTRIVVEGYYKGSATPSYYGLDILYPSAVAGADSYDIDRNKIYALNITEINKDGYRTYEDAVNAEPFGVGIVVDIEVKDENSHNIVTNGKQYMGSSNTELVIYPATAGEPINFITAAVISYTTQVGWTRGELTATGGITFVSGSGSVAKEYLELGIGSSPVVREVQINVPAGFTSGEIKAHIGNISQTIRVVKRSPMPKTGNVVEDFATNTDYVTAEIIKPDVATEWLKVSADIVGLAPSSLVDKITKEKGGVYIHAQGHIGFNVAKPRRKAQLYVASRNNEQRTRVHVEQDFLDVYSGRVDIEPFTYVGVFHRWNETGERIIRIKADQRGFVGTPGVSGSVVNITGDWIATVVHGDFIKLSTDAPADNNIKAQDPFGDLGVSTWSAQDIEANGQFRDDEGSKSVRGTVNATTPNIYFKVATTGRLASAHSEPRYGVIAITYNLGSTHLIYVRQGEEADYLMRPGDPVVYTAAFKDPSGMSRPASEGGGIYPNIKENMATRIMARRLSPYNLRYDGALSNLTKVPLTSHKFTEFPSQSGDFYFAGGDQVVPIGLQTSITSSAVSMDWNPTASENCPAGYRRISDTPTPTTAISEELVTVAGSENRQSYWLFPMKSKELSNFSNQIKGFIADGYFDRRQIVANQKQAGYLNYNPFRYCVVRSNMQDRNTAYWGYLVFNPYNYASVFLPLSGGYSQNGSPTIPSYRNDGEFAGFHTISKYANTNNWLTNYGLIGAKNVFDNYKSTYYYDAYNIRCIKDDNPPIVNQNPGDVTVGGFVNSGDEFISARIYYANTQTLQWYVMQAYKTEDERKRINSIILSGSKAITPDDDIYLNNWADLSPNITSDWKLQHITIRGIGTKTIPADAYTSDEWRSITIIDAKEFADGAFNLSANSKLGNLILGNYTDFTMNNAAFSAAMPTDKINLKLGKAEYAKRVGNSWKGRTWKSITEYK